MHNADLVRFPVRLVTAHQLFVLVALLDISLLVTSQLAYRVAHCPTFHPII